MSSIDQWQQPRGSIQDTVILVVDDVAMNRQVLGVVLRKAGYQVMAASSAHEALQQVSHQLPDLIMLDILMPGEDGYTLCNKFLADPRTQKVPIIFISALEDSMDKVKAFESGGVDFVSRPFSAQEVLVRVAHHLKVARLQSELEREKQELVQMNQKLRAAQQQTETVFNAFTELLPGLLLDGRYRIEEKIGSGGSGIVYRAIHQLLNRPVAIKVFRPLAHMGKLDALTRFQQEGISACRVNHPSAVTILDSGLSGQGIAYLVMELLEGQTLHDQMAARQLSVARCLEILIPLCDVLITAHAADIVHRDIKPENIMLHHAPEGEVVKVLDFGIAKLLGTESQGQVVTTRNELLGTPTYMAPERLDGRAYDGRSDIYSVGVMLYEMLTAEVPFGDRGEPYLKIMLNHLHARPIPVRTYRPDLSEGMAELIMRAMSRDPAQRPTAEQLQQALIALAEHESVPVPTARLVAMTSMRRAQSASSSQLTRQGTRARETTDAVARQWSGETSNDVIEIVLKPETAT